VDSRRHFDLVVTRFLSRDLAHDHPFSAPRSHPRKASSDRGLADPALPGHENQAFV
jgi:hypothetical protein